MKQREIKFRGYATGIGWVEGSLINNLWKYSEHSQYEKGSPCYEIITGQYNGDCWSDVAEQEGDAIVSVVPQSVGQFTGLLDKNGREIYEGDVIKWIHKHGDFEPTEQVSTVEYQKYSDGWIGYEVFNDAEIIGNLYENPELLK